MDDMIFTFYHGLQVLVAEQQSVLWPFVIWWSLWKVFANVCEQTKFFLCVVTDLKCLRAKWNVSR